jgi:hypothetical protein
VNKFRGIQAIDRFPLWPSFHLIDLGKFVPEVLTVNFPRKPRHILVDCIRGLQAQQSPSKKCTGRRSASKTKLNLVPSRNLCIDW